MEVRKRNGQALVVDFSFNADIRHYQGPPNTRLWYIEKGCRIPATGHIQDIYAKVEDP